LINILIYAATKMGGIYVHHKKRISIGPLLPGYCRQPAALLTFGFYIHKKQTSQL
jgi:hypothetical protein